MQVVPARAEARRDVRVVVHVPYAVPGDRLRVFAAPVSLSAEQPWLGGPALLLPAGLGPVAREALPQAGYRVECAGQVPPPLPPSDAALLEGLRALDRVLLDTIQRHDRALLRYGPGVDLAHLIAQVARAWPGLTVTALAARRGDAWRLGRALGGLLPDLSVVTGQGGPAEVGRVVAATCTGLGHSAGYRLPDFRVFDASWTDVVIALDALEATSQVGWRWLHRAERPAVRPLAAPPPAVAPGGRPAPRPPRLPGGGRAPARPPRATGPTPTGPPARWPTSCAG